MKSAGDLVGKGLSVWVILELIALNLAWMVVLAVPMAVLVATLMAFGKLSSDNETTIMRASGMSLYRMIFPVIIAAGAITYGLVIFNNDVLPEANIRLRTLMTDIIRIKPTLSIQAGVFTSESDLPNYRILVRKTFVKSNDLEGVTIYDLSRPGKNVVLTAQEGKVTFSPDYSKIFMDLDSGEIHELSTDKLLAYRSLKFHRHRVSIPATGFDFERSDASTAQRDDRTMSSNMMRAIVDSTKRMRETKFEALRVRLQSHLEGFIRKQPQLYSASPLEDFRSVVIRRNTMQHRREIGTDETMPSTAATPVSVQTGYSRSDSIASYSRALTDLRQTQSLILGDIAGIEYDERQADKYLVEIYKKYSIPFACIVFVLIGIPLGMMARRGGFGVGAGLSLGFFLFYWACLIGGEKLADRDILSPFWGMWLANILLGLCGIVLTLRTARETTVIDWSRLQRFIPKTWRIIDVSGTANPHEAS